MGPSGGGTADVSLSNGHKDVEFSACGEIFVADIKNHRICVISADGTKLLRSWGVMGTSDGKFCMPVALSLVQNRLFVLDAASNSDRVQVFQ